MLQSRALGFWETFKAITHDVCQGFETICATIQVDGIIDLPLFIKALEFTYHRHPLLQATIREDNEVYYYDFHTTFKDIPVQCTKGVSEAILRRSFLDGANGSVEPEKYLWKVDIFYEKEELIFTIVMHHAPCDGLSMVSILDDILYSYSCFLNNEIPNRPNLPLLPATEHLSTTHITVEDYLKQREELSALTTVKNSKLSLGPQQNLVPIKDRSTHIVYKELNEEQTTKMLHFCFKNKLTSNSLLNGLMLIVAQRVHEAPLSLAMLTPMRINASIKDQVGCHVCLVSTVYDDIDSNSDLLELAHEYQTKMTVEFKKQGTLPKEFTKADVANAFGLNLVLDFYKYQLVVTNLGTVELKKSYQSNTVKNVLLGVNNRVGAVSCVLIAYILHNKLQLGFVYTKPLVSDEYIERFTQEYMDSLLQLRHNL